MGKKINNDKTFKYAQGCDSKECKERYKNDLQFPDECPATAHELNFTTKKITCLLCGKETKYRGN